MLSDLEAAFVLGFFRSREGWNGETDLGGMDRPRPRSREEIEDLVAFDGDQTSIAMIREEAHRAALFLSNR